MKKTLALSMALLACAAVVPAFAQTNDAAPNFTTDGTAPVGGKRGMRGMRRGDGGGRFGKLQQILTPAQKEQFKSIMQESRTQTKPLMERMQALRAQMKGGGSMDDKTKAEFASLRQQLKAQREANQAKLMAILTPEQKAQFEQSGGFGSGFGGGGGKRNWRKNAQTAVPQ